MIQVKSPNIKIENMKFRSEYVKWDKSQVKVTQVKNSDVTWNSDLTNKKY